MEIIERSLQGKVADQSKCEDVIVETDNFLAVIDGATSKVKFDFGGETGGRIAAKIIAETIETLPADIEAKAAIEKISATLSENLALMADSPEKTDAIKREPPSATVVIYSNHRNEIWRVGDGQFMVDGELHAGYKASDVEFSRHRAFLYSIAILKGEDHETALKSARSGIEKGLLEVGAAANNEAAGAIAYGVINGDPKAANFLKVVDVRGAKDIVLATDGYPNLKPTLKESEADLQYLIAVDPACIKENPSTKGLTAGQLSFDDRAYLRFKPCRPAAEAATIENAKTLS